MIGFMLQLLSWLTHYGISPEGVLVTIEFPDYDTATRAHRHLLRNAGFSPGQPKDPVMTISGVKLKLTSRV